MVVLTSECPNSSCTFFGAAPFADRLLVLVMIVLFMKNTDFMQGLEVQNSKMGKLKAVMYCKLEAVLL